MSDIPTFHRSKHAKYWLRCLHSPLPHHYTSEESNRMTLAFFTLAALDLLDLLQTHVTVDERASYVHWIYSCQHPEGGFRGFPATARLGDDVWDTATLPATLFALGSLAVLQDGMDMVKRKACLSWLRRLQREDGSFGESLGEDGKIEGGKDARLGYMASGIRWILRGEMKGPVDGVEDIDVERLVECVQGAQSYDGGIAEAPFQEAHAGFTFTSIGILALLGRLGGHPKASATNGPSAPRPQPTPGLFSVDATVKWLVSRQTTMIDEYSMDDDPEDDSNIEHNGSIRHGSPQPFKLFDAFSGVTATPIFFDEPRPRWVGFTGRINKIADTCYAFWVGGALHILDSLQLVDPRPIRCWLLEKTQHPILGGFAKMPGYPPDIYHSYLGLGALSLLNDASACKLGSEIVESGPHDIEQIDGLQKFDPALCFSVRAKNWIEDLSWRREILSTDSKLIYES